MFLLVDLPQGSLRVLSLRFAVMSLHRFLRIQFKRSQRSFIVSEKFFLFKSLLMSSLAGRFPIARKAPFSFEIFLNSVFLVYLVRFFVILFSSSGGLLVMKRGLLLMLTFP
jgi:hypothetical protein